MTLTATELTLIRDSYDAVRLEIEPASTAFYDFLFERAPDLRRLFRDDLAGQGMKFMTTLGIIVDALDEEESLSRKLKDLGAFHGAIGIKPEHFEPMESALMDTFDLILGKRFKVADRAAWQKAYRMIATEMVAAGAGQRD